MKYLSNSVGGNPTSHVHIIQKYQLGNFKHVLIEKQKQDYPKHWVPSLTTILETMNLHLHSFGIDGFAGTIPMKLTENLIHVCFQSLVYEEKKVKSRIPKQSATSY